MTPDALFSNPRLAALYDAFNGDRADLDFYLELVHKYEAKSVLDIGCGTGVFACRLAARGVQAVGLDPAAASLEIARRRPEASQVRWIEGYVEAAADVRVDMAVMTGNVAQVFLTDDGWAHALRAIRNTLNADGRLVFEIRNPERQAWRRWTKERTFARTEIDGVGAVRTWCELTKVDGPIVSFRWTFEFETDGATIASDSTLRFRTRAEVEWSLNQEGFTVECVLDAPDRPGRELIFVAGRV